MFNLGRQSTKELRNVISYGSAKPCRGPSAFREDVLEKNDTAGAKRKRLRSQWDDLNSRRPALVRALRSRTALSLRNSLVFFHFFFKNTNANCPAVTATAKRRNTTV